MTDNGWEVSERGSWSRDTDPKLSIYPSGAGHLNETAIDKWFDPPEHVLVLVKPGKLALKPGAGDHPEGRTLSDRHELHLRTPLREAGVDLESHDETARIDLEYDADSDLVIVDLTEIMEQFECDHPDCDETFTTERGKNIHYGRVHEDNGEDPEPVDPPVEDDLDAEFDDVGSIDVEAFGYPYTTGNIAMEITRADGVYDLSKRLEVSRAEAEELCRTLGLAERLKNGEDLPEDEVRERVFTAAEQGEAG